MNRIEQRAAFEETMRTILIGYSWKREEDGYVDEELDSAWLAWQAAQAVMQSQITMLDELTDRHNIHIIELAHELDRCRIKKDDL